MKFLVPMFFVMLTCFAPLRAADDYQLGPDSQPQEGVPKGKIVSGKHTSEKIFEGAVRD
jgi:hypothetical protein